MMEKVKKSYVEKSYIGTLYNHSLFSEVESRDPMKIEIDDGMIGFRFFDRVILNEKNGIVGPKINCSNWIYLGKRLSFDEVKVLSKNNIPAYERLAILMEINNYQYVCRIQAVPLKTIPMKDGDMTLDEYVAQKEQQDREQAVSKEKSDAEVKKMKYTLMREGMGLVKPERAEEWLELVDDFSNKGGFYISILKAMVSMMKRMETGISFEEAEQQVYCEELGLEEFVVNIVASFLFYYAKQGEGYNQYWNKKYGVELLQIKKK